MKKSIFNILIVLLLIVSIVASCRHLSMIFMPEETPRTMDSLYSQVESQVDVLAIGSSRTYCNILPSVLWDEYGISMYQTATPGQPLNLSYYALKEALKKTSPKVVVLEVSQIDPKNEPQNDFDNMALQTGMHYSLNQMAALFDKPNWSTFADSLFRLPSFHNRYSELSKYDFTKMDYNMFPKYGAEAYKGLPCNLFSESPRILPSDFSDTTDEYYEERYSALEKFYSLCNTEGVPLVLVLTPSANFTEFQSVTDFSENHNIDYINYVKLSEEIGIKGDEDFFDSDHLNYYGATKTTRHLGQFLINKFGVANHKGDAAYASWDEYSAYIADLYNSYYLSYETGLGNYFNYIPNDNYIVITYLKGDYDTKYVGQQSVLEKLGCNEEAYERGGIWALDGKTNLLAYQTPDMGETEWYDDLYGSSFSLKSNEQGSQIFINGKEYEIRNANGGIVENGLQFLIYDKLSQQVIDFVCFDSYNDYAIVRAEKNTLN